MSQKVKEEVVKEVAVKVIYETREAVKKELMNLSKEELVERTFKTIASKRYGLPYKEAGISPEDGFAIISTNGGGQAARVKREEAKGLIVIRVSEADLEKYGEDSKSD